MTGRRCRGACCCRQSPCAGTDPGWIANLFTAALRKVADLPHDLDGFDDDDRRRMTLILPGPGATVPMTGYHRASSSGVVGGRPARTGTDPVHLTWRRAPAIYAKRCRCQTSMWPMASSTRDDDRARLAGIVSWLNDE